MWTTRCDYKLDSLHSLLCVLRDTGFAIYQISENFHTLKHVFFTKPNVRWLE